MKLRTTDTAYGPDYWNSLDGGAGYRDSLMWADIALVIHELWGVDRVANRDVSMERSVLDVGCAMGWLLVHLRKRGFDVRGVDFSPYALDNAPEDIRFYTSSFDLTSPLWSADPARPAASLALAHGPFDVVTCFETLEHIPEASVATALAHLRSAMKPGGHGLFTICTEDQPGWDSDPTHVTIESREWWGARLAAAGLEPAPALEDNVRRFWLFSAHRGLFVVRRPEA